MHKLKGRDVPNERLGGPLLWRSASGQNWRTQADLYIQIYQALPF